MRSLPIAENVEGVLLGLIIIVDLLGIVLGRIISVVLGCLFLRLLLGFLCVGLIFR